LNDYNLGDVRFYIDHDKSFLYTERHDKLTREGVYAEWYNIQQLEGFVPSYDSIADYSFVPDYDFDLSELKEISKEMSNYDVRTGNVAIVTGIDAGRFLLAQFFCRTVNMVNRRKHQVFKSKAEAESWLLSIRKNK